MTLPFIRLSIVIVARNEEKNIARCIESVLKHTASSAPVEILLVDSASTDHTVDIAQNYPIGIISLRPQWPLSPAAGRFSGVNNVSGEYVLTIDGDMELLPGWVEEAVAFMDAHPQTASVVGRHYDVWPIPGGIHRGVDRLSRLQSGTSKIDYVFCSSIFRRSALLKIGNFQPFLRAEEEAEASYRLRRAGYDLYYLPQDSINHYSIPRDSFAETLRRLRRNLWAGGGDMLSWCLRQGCFGIIWTRFYVFFMFTALVCAIGTGLILAVIFHNIWWAVGALLLGFLFVGGMCVKKRSLYHGLLSVVNIACAACAMWHGFFRHIPPIESYPRDVVFHPSKTEFHWKKIE